MKKKNKKISLSLYQDNLLMITCILLAVFGFFMILSAEMGEATADITILSSATVKQIFNLVLGFGLLFFCTYAGRIFINIKRKYYDIVYWIMLAILFIPRMFSPVGGAYGWIRIAGFSIQPSEFAKVFIIIYASKVFAKNNPKGNKKDFGYFALKLFIYFIVVMGVEKDLGSAVVILIIGYICMLIAPYDDIKIYQNRMIFAGCIGIILIFIGLSPIGTRILEHFDDDYKVLRFLSSANPFNYQYDSGYHLVMSLVSIATGGLTGLGYGKSIHKFMNFPNPSTDFILPVIIEELGLFPGFTIVAVGYAIILIRLGIHAKRIDYVRGKIVIIGTFMYFLCHFVLNVGGVSGLIPLTGVPLLLISSGGSSLMACLCAIGFSECEIINYRKRVNEDENNSR